MNPKLKRRRPPGEPTTIAPHNAFIKYIILLQSFCLLGELVCIVQWANVSALWLSFDYGGRKTSGAERWKRRSAKSYPAVGNYNNKFLFYNMSSTAVLCRRLSAWFEFEVVLKYSRASHRRSMGDCEEEHIPLKSWWTTLLDNATGFCWILRVQKDDNLPYLRKWSVAHHDDGIFFNLFTTGSLHDVGDLAIC